MNLRLLNNGELLNILLFTVKIICKILYFLTRRKQMCSIKYNTFILNNKKYNNHK